VKLSDQIMLARLRKYTRLTESQWLALEAEVVKAGGILKATGTAHAELMYCAGVARAEVLKHPGHPDQSVHGNGGKNSNPKGTPAGGGGGGLTPEDEEMFSQAEADLAADRQAIKDDIASGDLDKEDAGEYLQANKDAAQAVADHKKAVSEYRKNPSEDNADKVMEIGDYTVIDGDLYGGSSVIQDLYHAAEDMIGV
jgi:hypothetical protein